MASLVRVRQEFLQNFSSIIYTRACQFEFLETRPLSLSLFLSSNFMETADDDHLLTRRLMDREGGSTQTADACVDA